MVFKGRFFSSRKSGSSTPDGSSSSPGSVGSNPNSPIRSDKKKHKSLMPAVSKDDSPAARTPTGGARGLLRRKESSSTGKEKLNPSKPSSVISSNSSAATNSKKPVEVAGAGAASMSVSPIMASSLGLNKIKTRSGPLPQESTFSFGSREKGAVLGASNLSKPLGGGDGVRVANKKDTPFNDNVDNGSISDSMSTESGASRDQSPHVYPGQARSRLQHSESAAGAGQFESSGDDSRNLRNSDAHMPGMKTSSYVCDNPTESESPRFQAILRVTSAPRKRFPGDIKSFSHELNSKGVRPYPFWKPRRLNHVEEVLAMIRAKFDKAKEEVDAELHIFAADLVGVLEKNAETHPEWQENIEDLLILTRSCAMASPGEFWLQCEGIVQELDDRRQELPVGTLKQLHTRMLFILTRCTRLLQLHKESALAEDEHTFHIPQSFIRADKQVAPGTEQSGKMSGDLKALKRSSMRKSYSQEQSDWKRERVVPGNLVVSASETIKSPDSSSGRVRMASWKKFSFPSGRTPKGASSVNEDQDKNITASSSILDEQSGNNDIKLANNKLSESSSSQDLHASLVPKHQHKVSWGYCGEHPYTLDDNSIICRICEEEVPTLHVEDHSRICAIADRCDEKDLKVNERLLRIADTLEKLMDSFSEKDSLHAAGSPNGAKASNSNVTEETEFISPKFSDWSRRGSEDMLDSDDNNIGLDDMRSLPSMSCRTRFGPRSDQGMTTSSAGSVTPRSPLLTPEMSQIDLLFF